MLFVATALATLGPVLVATTSFAQSSTGCRAYAEDYAERYAAGSALGDALRVGGRPSAASAMAASTARRLRKSTLLTMHTHDACKTDGREGQSIESEAINFTQKHGREVLGIGQLLTGQSSNASAVLT
jgi:hypothetical protein